MRFAHFFVDRPIFASVTSILLLIIGYVSYVNLPVAQYPDITPPTVEVSAYYIPAWEGSAIYVPSMLLLSAVKFFIVVMFYMHLKYDHKLFRSLFTGPLFIAALTLIGLLFLFAKLSVRLGLLSSGQPG